MKAGMQTLNNGDCSAIFFEDGRRFYNLHDNPSRPESNDIQRAVRDVLESQHGKVSLGNGYSGQPLPQHWQSDFRARFHGDIPADLVAEVERLFVEIAV